MAPTNKSSSSKTSTTISNAKAITSIPVVNTILRAVDPIYALKQDIPDIKNAVNTAAKTVKSTVDKIGNPVYSSWGSSGSSKSGSSGSSGGSLGSGSVGSGGFKTDSSGKVTFADKDTELAMNMINQISQANNEWSAQQAQKQMDFQKMMSDTAHQREVADLQAAGLNPVLSAGGSGASTPVGAMAQTDDSNTRLIAELVYAALEAVQQTAEGVAIASGVGGKSSNTNVNLFGKLSNAYKNDKLVKKAVDTGFGFASKVGSAYAIKALMSFI